MHIVIAPNAFKNSLGAVAAADAIAEGLDASRYAGTHTRCPVADGGDGTLELLLRHLGGRLLPAIVRDPLGRQIESRFGLSPDGRTAIIELAAASGLRLLRADELLPLQATSAGTGDLMRCALAHGARRLVLCVGGSATVDGGAGLLRSLGVGFLDAAGRPLPDMPSALVHLASIDTSGLDSRLGNGSVTVLCDVENPLTGDRGAAHVFGPQKGAGPDAVSVLEAALAHFAQTVRRQTGRDIAAILRGGAAGGVAAGLHALAGAELVGGADYFLDQIGFDRMLDSAAVVITGEGSLDDQTLNGKAPWTVATRAKSRGIFVIGLAGQVPRDAGPRLRAAFDVLLPIGHRAMPLAEALRCTAADLRRTARELGNLLGRAALDKPLAG